MWYLDKVREVGLDWFRAAPQGKGNGKGQLWENEHAFGVATSLHTQTQYRL